LTYSVFTPPGGEQKGLALKPKNFTGEGHRPHGERARQCGLPIILGVRIRLTALERPLKAV